MSLRSEPEPTEARPPFYSGRPRPKPRQESISKEEIRAKAEAVRKERAIRASKERARFEAQQRAAAQARFEAQQTVEQARMDAKLASLVSKVLPSLQMAKGTPAQARAGTAFLLMYDVMADLGALREQDLADAQEMCIAMRDGPDAAEPAEMFVSKAEEMVNSFDPANLPDVPTETSIVDNVFHDVMGSRMKTTSQTGVSLDAETWSAVRTIINAAVQQGGLPAGLLIPLSELARFLYLVREEKKSKRIGWDRAIYNVTRENMDIVLNMFASIFSFVIEMYLLPPGFSFISGIGLSMLRYLRPAGLVSTKQDKFVRDWPHSTTVIKEINKQESGISYEPIIEAKHAYEVANNINSQHKEIYTFDGGRWIVKLGKRLYRKWVPDSWKSTRGETDKLQEWFDTVHANQGYYTNLRRLQVVIMGLQVAFALFKLGPKARFMRGPEGKQQYDIVAFQTALDKLRESPFPKPMVKGMHAQEVRAIVMARTLMVEGEDPDDAVRQITALAKIRNDYALLKSKPAAARELAKVKKILDEAIAELRQGLKTAIVRELSEQKKNAKEELEKLQKAHEEAEKKYNDLKDDGATPSVVLAAKEAMDKVANELAQADIEHKDL